MAEFIFYIWAVTLPFHLFAYIPFWNHLRFSKRVTALLLILEQFVYTGLLLWMIHIGFFVTQAEFIAVPLYGGLFFYFVKMDWGKIAFLYIFTTDYLMTIRGIVFFFGNQPGSFESYSWQAGVLALLLFFLSLPFMVRYICRTAEMVFSIDAPIIWKTIWLLPLFTSIIVLMFTYPVTETTPRTLSARVLLMLCMFLIYYHILLIIRQIQKQAAAEEQARNLEHLIQVQAGQYALIQSRMEETQRAQHDLRQHWAALQGYLENDSQDALKDYIKRYGSSLPTDSRRMLCKNFAVDALLNFYVEKAMMAEIPMEISFQTGTKTIIPEPEFCVLLGNLLENALDACSETKNTQELPENYGTAEKKPVSPDSPCFIRVNARQKGESMLSLTVDNTCPCPPEMEGEQIRSSKHEGFGIGTLSVQMIAKRYHGDARLEWKDGVFYASIMLNP